MSRLASFLRTPEGGANELYKSSPLRDNEGASADVISRAVVEGWTAGDAFCSQVVDLAAANFGCAVGDFALKHFPRSGVFLGGGMSKRLLAHFRDEATFMREFGDKGRLS